jgi:hypothetical protein
VIAIDDQSLRVGYSLDHEPLALALVSGLPAAVAEFGVVDVWGDDDLGQA